MAYSLDLRERVVAAVKEGMTQPEVAERFKVSLSSVERYVRREREGALRAKQPPGRPASITPTLYGALAEQVAQHNDASLKEHCELWRQEQGTSVPGRYAGHFISVYAMCRAMKRVGRSRKKRL